MLGNSQKYHFCILEFVLAYEQESWKYIMQYHHKQCLTDNTSLIIFLSRIKLVIHNYFCSKLADDILVEIQVPARRSREPILTQAEIV